MFFEFCIQYLVMYLIYEYYELNTATQLIGQARKNKILFCSLLKIEEIYGKKLLSINQFVSS